MHRIALALVALFALCHPSLGHAAESVRYDNVVVVTIGISDYPDAPLPNAARDAEDFADLFRAEHIGLIELYDAQATRKKIRHAIRRQAPGKLRAPGDRNLLIVYFVGHGRTSDGIGYLAPHGAEDEDGWLAMSSLRDMAKQSKRFRHQLYILGSCFGGDVLRGVPSAEPERRQAELVRNDPVARWVADAMAKRTRVALTAGSAHQKVPDGEVGQGSPFGRALVNAFGFEAGSGFMAADFNRDGCTSHAELTAYVEGHGRSRHNTPRSGTLDGDDAGTVVLCQSAFATPSAAAPTKRERFRGATRRPGMPEDLVEVPAGSFVMGSPDGEDGRVSGEGPQHRVTISRPLWVQTREVTQAEWKRLMGTAPAYFAGCDDCPVEMVNWYEAIDYANARSRSEGLGECYTMTGCGHGAKGGGCEKGADRCVRETWRCGAVELVGLGCRGYRLPTEAEWEYFGRAGTTTRYSSGDRRLDLPRFAHETYSVGSTAANAWGLHDVHGNVKEWCQDHWRREYSVHPVTDPLQSSGEGRVVRGGSFEDAGRGARSASRSSWGATYRYRGVGFRLVRAAP